MGLLTSTAAATRPQDEEGGHEGGGLSSCRLALALHAAEGFGLIMMQQQPQPQVRGGDGGIP